MNFADLSLEESLSSCTHARLDELEFGVVKMDKTGTVVYYNAYESRLSGLGPTQVVGRDFFTEVAPCTNNALVARRYEDDALDETLNYVFTYRMKPTPVRLRLLKAVASPHQFLVVEWRPRT